VQLLIVTDHRFQQTTHGVFDSYCFGYDFFADYLDVFDHVTVAARMTQVLAPTGHRADGPGLQFMALPDQRGPRWAVAALAGRRRLDEALRAADAVCLRIPSLAAVATLRAIDAHKLPVMFEMIGDPVEAVRGSRLVTRALGGALGSWIVRQVIRRASVGSYVSDQHLQRRYPAAAHVTTEQISSIRLPASQILAPKVFQRAPEPLRVILVASFMPVKAHEVLIRATAIACARGVQIKLTLVGDGPCRGAAEDLVRRLALAESVTFTGHVAERAQVFELLDGCDLFAMSSISEGMPRAMIEAMSRGLPAIGSDAPGIAELLPATQRFRIGRHDQLAELMVRLSRNPQLLSELATTSHAIALRFEQNTLRARRRRLLLELRERATAKRQGGI